MPDSDPSAHAPDVPGGHAGFVMYPEQCGRVLHRVLSETPS